MILKPSGDESWSDGSSVDSGDDSLMDDSSESESQTNTTTNGSSSEALKEQRDEIRALVEKETKDVILWKEILTGMMIITACIVSVATYIFLSKQEVDSFTNGFQEVGLRVQLAAEKNMDTICESFRGLDSVLSTLGNDEWPLATIPDFAVHGEHLRVVSGTVALWWAPLVSSMEEKPSWEIHVQSLEQSTPVYPSIYQIHNRTVEEAQGPGPFCPVAQMHPPSQELQIVHSPVNYDMLSDEFFAAMIQEANAHGDAVLSDFAKMELFRQALDYDREGLISLFILPIFNGADHTGPIVGYLQGFISWATMFSGIITEESEATYVVLHSHCGEEEEEEGESKAYTYYIDGPEAKLLGEGELFPKEYETQKMSSALHTNNSTDGCYYVVDLYPSAAMRQTYHTVNPELFAVVVAVIFFLMVFAFFLYEGFVQRRNDKVVATAARTNAIVSEMFPGAVRDRLLASSQEKEQHEKRSWLAPKTGLKNFLDDGNDGSGMMQDSKPLADLFPETTIMFADLVGFTAWSSVRDPSQVFTLLETIFKAFDEIARRRRIFKVETVGDCYVAVAGLPEPRRDHSTVMAKFSSECLRKVHELTKKMEKTLGPDTADLTVRIGLHSGPVTAGVLRGERARFQLFGDTMNVAARMEHNGTPDKIQCSQETADLLVAAGKAHWISAREDVINAKGKGEMNTYWVKPGSKGSSSGGSSESVHSSNLSSSGNDHLQDDLHFDEGQFENGRDVVGDKTVKLMNSKTKRLVEWNVEVLTALLKKIVALHGYAQSADSLDPTAIVQREPGTTVLDEVKEIIHLPEFDAEAGRHQVDADSVELPRSVTDQLHQYVSSIAVLYLDNPFHNFEHASHVTMSVTKLLGRIVAPSDLLNKLDSTEANPGDLASSLHDNTYGITSDPLTQFACVFSALVHDVDHRGVPNTRLVEENRHLASLYKGKSVAEQNSIDLAWDLLMDSEYKDLRTALLRTEAEFVRFRQLVVNSVLATDIMDKDLKMLRNARWEKAFSGKIVEANVRDGINRKATIVIEHLIQASDIAHAMQHWHIYRKWNERLFMELYKAFKEGRAATDPSEGWYKGEIGFFDFYIIPLAKKLKDCGVFGVSSDEYLNYAEKNRKEWESKGQQVVAEMVEKVKGES